MCTDLQEFTTVVGPRQSVLKFVERSVHPEPPGLADRPTMPTVWQRYELASPATLIDLATLSDDFTQPDSPAVAVVHHSGHSSFAVAAELQAELLVGDPINHLSPLPDLLCEPGFLFEGSAAVSGSSVQITAMPRIRSAMPSVPNTDRADGYRVALLDSGSRQTKNVMIDFTTQQPTPIRATDDVGHGEAVSQIIASLCPQADIYPLRVLGPFAVTGPSYQVFAGLSLALFSGDYDVVNASLTTGGAGDMCENTFGYSVAYITRICQAKSKRPLPLIVAAAGNGNPHPSRYPAVLPGAVVAVALETDAAGQLVRANYNSTTPANAIEQKAFGGAQHDPVGTVTSPGRPVTNLYGTSFATAAVTAAYLP